MLRHSYHIVDPSPWPFATAVAALQVVTSAILVIHKEWKWNFCGYFLLFYSIMVLIIIVSMWWRDIIREGTFLGEHTNRVQMFLRFGFLLFIVSETMLFFSFFFAYFDAALAPTHQIGGVWPPMDLPMIDPWLIPLSNTLILLLSGVTITWAHHSILAGDRLNCFYGLLVTILLGTLFTFFQLYEYIHAPFQINDSIYGSTFYMTTGFHGVHVIIGTLFILVACIRHFHHHFSPTHHVGLEGAIWYWHFVDIVWLFVYVTMYIWPTL